MIPYIAALIAMIFVAYRSDRTLERRYHAAIPVMIAGASLVLLGATASPAFVSVIFWCFAAAGVYSLLPPFWSMPNEFLSGFSAAAGIASGVQTGNRCSPSARHGVDHLLSRRVACDASRIAKSHFRYVGCRWMSASGEATG
jgi:hypothetical protein